MEEIHVHLKCWNVIFKSDVLHWLIRSALQAATISVAMASKKIIWQKNYCTDRLPSAVTAVQKANLWYNQLAKL